VLEGVGAEVLGVLVTGGEAVVGALEVLEGVVVAGLVVVAGVVEGLKKLCRGAASGLAPALVSEGKLHLYTRNSSFSPSNP
jgi:hypothetical protein